MDTPVTAGESPTEGAVQIDSGLNIEIDVAQAAAIMAVHDMLQYCRETGLVHTQAFSG